METEIDYVSQEEQYLKTEVIAKDDLPRSPADCKVLPRPARGVLDPAKDGCSLFSALPN